MPDKPVFILGIESSCDETSAAVTCDTRLLSNIVANQDTIHRFYGGVVPELASRAHQQKIIPVVTEALLVANITKNELDAVAFTRGPGLMGALLVGVSFAKSFALALDIPLIEVNHMQGHVLAHFLEEEKAAGGSSSGSSSSSGSGSGSSSSSSSSSGQPHGSAFDSAQAPKKHESPESRSQSPVASIQKPAFPFLCLTVSGGHTQIVMVKSPLDMEIIGETKDDAAGEAFDKAAKVMGLPYPGGILIDRLAREGKETFKFPHPHSPGYHFSFSGLKTAFLNFINENTAKDPDFIQKHKADICASYQKTIVDILMNKLTKASQDTGINEIAISGGVSANSGLRNELVAAGKKNGWNTYIAPLAYCTDNAAMIAVAGYFKYLKKDFADQHITPLARMPF